MTEKRRTMPSVIEQIEDIDISAYLAPKGSGTQKEEDDSPLQTPSEKTSAPSEQSYAARRRRASGRRPSRKSAKGEKYMVCLDMSAFASELQLLKMYYATKTGRRQSTRDILEIAVLKLFKTMPDSAKEFLRNLSD